MQNRHGTFPNNGYIGNAISVYYIHILYIYKYIVNAEVTSTYIHIYINSRLYYLATEHLVLHQRYTYITYIIIFLYIDAGTSERHLHEPVHRYIPHRAPIIGPESKKYKKKGLGILN